MKPYGGNYYKHSEEDTNCKTKTAKLIAKNADRSWKKSVRQKVKKLIKKSCQD